MPRVFFGVEIPSEVKKGLLQLKSPINGARWQSRNQLHLTLVFVGSVEEDALATLGYAASLVSAPSFEVEVAGLGAFGRPEHPRNLWAGVSPEQPVADLYRQLSNQVSAAGFETEHRGFKPHITVARFRKQAASIVNLLEEHRDDRFGVLPVTEFVLFESTPGAGGSVYTVIGRFPLQPPLDETELPDQI
ncbi:MAG: RNA 2',3'-cyclic phosphodiesterase [Marinobacter sp.]|nr:RNA 2',3'-cyclic phosphodiesterase [Marinobacter sp.]